MFPVAILVATTAMASGVEGATFFTTLLSCGVLGRGVTGGPLDGITLHDLCESYLDFDALRSLLQDPPPRHRR